MKFSKDQVRDIGWDDMDDCKVVETIEGESRRWSRTNIMIVKKEDKYYELYWEEGLTEMQDNEFEDQDAPEVKPVEKTITTTEWVKVEA